MDIEIDYMLSKGWKIKSITEGVGYQKGYIKFIAPDDANLLEKTWKLKLSKQELDEVKSYYNLK
mgnify:CR=1 FL=1|jgi:hypothetical protein